MRISIIAAVSENKVIGKKDKIPWHITEDLRRFRDKTLGHVVIMGRNSFDSMLNYYQKVNKNLPKRIHIVVTRDMNYKINLPDCFVVHSIDKALNLAKKIEKEEIFISGGEQIFRQTINLAHRLYLTIVEGNFDGDRFFPDYSDFKKIISEEKKEEGNYKFKFVELER